MLLTACSGNVALTKEAAKITNGVALAPDVAGRETLHFTGSQAGMLAAFGLGTVIAELLMDGSEQGVLNKRLQEHDFYLKTAAFEEFRNQASENAIFKSKLIEGKSAHAFMRACRLLGRIIKRTVYYEIPLLNYIGWFVLMVIVPLGWILVARRRQWGYWKKGVVAVAGLVPLSVAAIAGSVLLNAVVAALGLR